MGGSWTRFCFLDGPTSCAILLLAYSIRMGPRSDDSRNEACRAAMTRAALPTSRYSTKTTGDPPPVAPAAAPAAGAPLLVVCMRSRQKPGKLCNKNTTRVHCTASCSRWWWLWWWFVGQLWVVNLVVAFESFLPTTQSHCCQFIYIYANY